MSPFARGGDREGPCRGTDRARAAGGHRAYLGMYIWDTRRGRSQPCTHPLQPPSRGFRGPLRWCRSGSSARGGWVVPGITHPVYPPGPHPGYTPVRVPTTRMSGLVHTADGRGDHWDVHIWPF